MDQEKRRYRQLKRDLKQAGNRKRRRHLQRELSANPDDAAETDFEFGRFGTADLNGNDRDATRRRDHPPAQDNTSGNGT
jgi:hypothetical protein